MGFGMQKWIYHLKPRKPFSKERKGFGNTIPKHEHHNAFNDDKVFLTGRIRKEITEEEQQQQKILKRSRLFIKGFIITLAIGLFIGLINNFSFKEDNYFAQERRNQEIILKRQVTEKERAYQILLTSGKNAMQHKSYERAINEFDQALKLSHGKLEPRELLVSALILSCNEKGMNCDRALNESKFLYEFTQAPKHKEQLKLLYLHLGQFENADKLLTSNK